MNFHSVINMKKKDLIYKAAVKVIAREGFNNMRIQMIADEAQVAVGTIYLYYNSKEDILNSIILFEHQKRARYLDELEASGQSALEKLRAFLNFHFDSLICNIDIAKVLVQEIALLDMAFNDEVIASRIGMQNRILGLLIKAQDEGTVRRSDPQALMITLLNMSKGLMFSLFSKDNADEYSKLKEGIVDFLINGIRL